MKKSGAVVLIVLLAGSLIALGQNKRRSRTAQPKPPIDVSDVAKDAWTPITTSRLSVYAYNPAKITRTSKGTVKIWVKETPKAEQEYKWVREITARRKAELDDSTDYIKLHHILYLYEVDCDKSQLRVITRIDYDLDGQLLRTVTAQGDVEWDAVVPDSIGESFAEAACKGI